MHFEIKDLHPAFDGDAPLDVDYFTNRELRLIKEESGVRVGEIDEAFEARDNDLLVALAMIALQRKLSTRLTKAQRDFILDAPAGQLKLVGDEADPEDEEGTASPPVEPPSEPEPGGAANASVTSIGQRGESGGEPTPAPTDMSGIGGLS